jgi:hypothetical protein
MADANKAKSLDSEMEGTNASIERPRLTPQARTNPDAEGSDDTSPMPDEQEKQGQPSKAEG